MGFDPFARWTPEQIASYRKDCDRHNAYRNITSTQLWEICDTQEPCIIGFRVARDYVYVNTLARIEGYYYLNFGGDNSYYNGTAAAFLKRNEEDRANGCMRVSWWGCDCNNLSQPPFAMPLPFHEGFRFCNQLIFDNSTFSWIAETDNTNLIREVLSFAKLAEALGGHSFNRWPTTRAMIPCNPVSHEAFDRLFSACSDRAYIVSRGHMETEEALAIVRKNLKRWCNYNKNLEWMASRQQFLAQSKLRKIRRQKLNINPVAVLAAAATLKGQHSK